MIDITDVLLDSYMAHHSVPYRMIVYGMSVVICVMCDALCVLLVVYVLLFWC